MTVLYENRREEHFFVGPACVYPYPPHLHDAVEIVILQKGHLHMTVNGKYYTLEPDTALVVFPNTVHSYESASEDAKGLCVAFVPEMIRDFTHSLKSMVPVSPFVKIRDCKPVLRDAVDMIARYSQEEKTPHLMLALIHLLLSAFFLNMEIIPVENVEERNELYRTILYIHQHFTENLNLETVSRETGISKNRISRFFSQDMRINFRQFLNTLRIEHSCMLLQDDDLSVKEICYQCGFENTRTFHRAFLEVQKMTPGEYREQMKNDWLTVLNEAAGA